MEVIDGLTPNKQCNQFPSQKCPFRSSRAAANLALSFALIGLTAGELTGVRFKGKHFIIGRHSTNKRTS